MAAVREDTGVHCLDDDKVHVVAMVSLRVSDRRTGNGSGLRHERMHSYRIEGRCEAR